MLFQIGPVTLDTFPFNADEIDIDASADFASKAVIGIMPPRERMGEGEETIEIRGDLKPTVIGGLTELQALDQIMRSGRSVPVMRGDGVMLGWFVILRIRQGHSDLERSGVGFDLQHRITLGRSSPAIAAPNLISSIVGLFGASGA